MSGPVLRRAAATRRPRRDGAAPAEVRLLTNERYTANIAMYLRSGDAETHREPYQGTNLVYFRKVLPRAGAEGSG